MTEDQMSDNPERADTPKCQCGAPEQSRVHGYGLRPGEVETIHDFAPAVDAAETPLRDDELVCQDACAN